MDNSTASSLARTLMNEHGLGHWIFEFDRAKSRAGSCKHRRHTITLSPHYVLNNSDEDIKDTVLHEIAHALVGPKHGHDDIWKTVCTRIGARPIRCYGNHVTMPKGQWQANCPTCKKEFHCHRRPKNITSRYCMKCGTTNGRLTYSNSSCT
jgi:predicted SprT family Zn-dependent metalloprotease